MSEPSFCPLGIRLINWKTDKIYKESDHLQVHEQIIRPLFNVSTETYIYRGTAKERRYPWGDIIPGSEPVKLEDEVILKPKKGKYIFDKTQECITGHEYLWNAEACKRGSIVMVLENDFDFSEIFPYCYRPGISGTPNVGQSPSAVRLCNEMRKENIITATLLASNGIRYMKIYASDEAFERITSLAYSLCKGHDDWLNESFSQILS